MSSRSSDREIIFPVCFWFLIFEFPNSEWEDNYIPTQSETDSPPVDIPCGQPSVSLDSPDDIQPGQDLYCFTVYHNSLSLKKWVFPQHHSMRLNAAALIHFIAKLKRGVTQFLILLTFKNRSLVNTSYSPSKGCKKLKRLPALSYFEILGLYN